MGYKETEGLGAQNMKTTDPYIKSGEQSGEQIREDKESHMIYELKQHREYYIRKLIDIQKAIDAIRMINL